MNFIEHLETWLLLKRWDYYHRILVLQDNCHIHRSNEVKKFMDKEALTYWFIPAYTPEFAPVEKVFGIIKGKWRKIKTNKSINWSKDSGKLIIKDLMASVSKAQITSPWRRFITTLKLNIENLLKLLILKIWKGFN